MRRPVRGPVAVFDSGLGGLSVLREIRRVLPGEELLYLADQAHVPYGPRPPEEVLRFSEGIARFLLSQGSSALVVACNTASAAALHPLRAAFPGVPFVGMEPAVKPAARASRTGAIGVLATPGTFRGKPFCSVVERFAQGVRVCVGTCPGLVEAVERGRTDGPEVRRIVEAAVAPLAAEGIDTLVLGCTHYPLILSTIREVCGPGIEVIDPAPAVARQVLRVLEGLGGSAETSPPGRSVFFTSGSPEEFGRQLERLGFGAAPRAVAWEGGELRLAE